MKTAQMKYDLDILTKWLDGGLCHSAGDGKNTVCLEQAVALCAGLPLTDKPDSCVHPVLSAFGRRLNDSSWSSPQARSAGLRNFAFAQLGTTNIDIKRWCKTAAEQTIRQVVPLALRAAATRNPKHAEGLEAAAKRCEVEGTERAARDARKIAYDAADAAAYDAADAAYAAAAAAYAAADAAAYADAYASAAYAAAAAAYADAPDRTLALSAKIATDAINEQRSTP